MVPTSGSFELTAVGLLILIFLFRRRGQRKAIDAPRDGHDRAEQRETAWYGGHDSDAVASAKLLSKSANQK
jgi:hypothetical protein